MRPRGGRIPGWALVALVVLAGVAAGRDPAPRVALRKYQPVFEAGNEARLLADCRDVRDPRGWNLHLWLSPHTDLEREGHLLASRPLVEVFGESGSGERVPLAAPLPDDLSPGTYYVNLCLSASPRWDPAGVVARWPTQIVIVDRTFDRVDAGELVGRLKPEYVSAEGAVRLERVRAAAGARGAQVLGILFPPGQPAAVADVPGVAQRFVAGGRYPLSREVATYRPGADFWLAERSGPDLLELNALRILRILTAHYRVSGDRALLDRAVAYARDWRRFSAVSAFHSPFFWQEHAVPERLVSLLTLIDVLPDEPAYAAAYLELLAEIERHARLLAQHGFYAHWSNHGMYQMEALLAAATMFDCLAEAESWRATAVERAGRFMEKKFHADGGLDEGTASYAFIVLDKLLRIDALQRVGAPDAVLPARLAAACRFAAHTVKPDGALWAFGESFGRAPRFVYTAGLPGPLRALIDGALRPQRQEPFVSEQLFRESGYYFLTRDLPGSVEDFYLGFDFGTSVRATHFQDDTMHVELTLAGRDVLLDSGYYDQTRAPLNAFYKLPAAHNTFTADDGRTLRSIAEVELDSIERAGERIALAAHLVETDGTRFARRVACEAERQLLVLVDDLELAGGTAGTLFFHYGPQATVSASGNRLQIAFDGAEFRHTLVSDAPLTISLQYGADDPLQGWCSALEGERKARWSASVRVAARSARVVSVIGPPDLPAEALAAAQLADAAERGAR